MFYKKDLIADLKSELSGNFEDLILGLMTPRNKYLAQHLYKAIKGIGTSEDVLVEILFSCPYEEIVNVAAAYESSIYNNNIKLSNNNFFYGSFLFFFLLSVWKFFNTGY